VDDVLFAHKDVLRAIYDLYRGTSKRLTLENALRMAKQSGLLSLNLTRSQAKWCFMVSRMIVVDEVYSWHLAFYWPDKGYIIRIICPSIGQTRGVLSASVFLLVRKGVYSQRLASHWPTGDVPRGVHGPHMGRLLGVPLPAGGRTGSKPYTLKKLKP
jgi:hypothetical protein